jgi:cytosine/adenosine deaminase-related metal-dependent hydrolase
VRLVSAEWVLPVCAPAIPDGAVLVDDDRIVAVGPRAELEATLPPDVPRDHFEGCVLTPGLVNAHTHLTLTALAGVVPPAPFTEWLPSLVAAMKPWEIEDHEASGVIGAEESLLSGVTVVGDIAYGAAEVASASRAGLGGVYYWELLGIHAEQIDDDLVRLRYPATTDVYGPRVVCGLSPHSPYTSGPALLRAVHDKAAELRVPVATHVSESLGEVELLAHGTGPLAAVAERTAFGFTPPGTSTVAYLDGLGALSGVTAVHVCHLSAEDIATLVHSARGIVTCPRSNRYLDNPPPRIAPLLEAGLPVGVGTDSSASNHDLDLLAEVRALRASEPEITAEELLAIATIGGAAAIGVDEGFGTLEPGKFADLAVFAVAGADPLQALIELGGRENIRAVMSGGEWRVAEGKLLVTDAHAAERGVRATQLAREALAAR